MHIPAMEVISIKQIYDYIIWAAVLMAILFFLLNIPRLRNGLHKILYWRVYAIRYLTRKTCIESKFLRKKILFLVYFKKKQ